MSYENLFDTESPVFDVVHQLTKAIAEQTMTYEQARRVTRIAQDAVEDFEAKARYLVAASKDPLTEKPVFSNEAAREYAVRCMLHGGGGLMVPAGVTDALFKNFDLTGYLQAQVSLAEAEQQSLQEQVLLERLQRTFRVALLDYKAAIDCMQEPPSVEAPVPLHKGAEP